MNYRPTHFRLEELVPPDVFKDRGQAAWELLDPRMLATLDALRDNLGKIVVNDWMDGGNYRESGFRTATTTTGAVFSQHRYGRAFDCKFTITPREALQYIVANIAAFPHITTYENPDSTPTWLHLDCRNNPSPGLRMVNP